MNNWSVNIRTYPGFAQVTYSCYSLSEASIQMTYIVDRLVSQEGDRIQMKTSCIHESEKLKKKLVQISVTKPSLYTLGSFLNMMCTQIRIVKGFCIYHHICFYRHLLKICIVRWILERFPRTDGYLLQIFYMIFLTWLLFIIFRYLIIFYHRSTSRCG